MNEQNLNINQVPVAPPPVPQPVRTKISDMAKDIFRKIYQNKKIFWLVIIIFSILFLVIIIGLIFSALKNKGQPKTLASPTPEVTFQPGEVGGNENITKLKDLKEKILSLDIYQKRLSPPSVNFKISF